MAFIRAPFVCLVAIHYVGNRFDIFCQHQHLTVVRIQELTRPTFLEHPLQLSDGN